MYLTLDLVTDNYSELQTEEKHFFFQVDKISYQMHLSLLVQNLKQDEWKKKYIQFPLVVKSFNQTVFFNDESNIDFEIYNLIETVSRSQVQYELIAGWSYYVLSSLGHVMQ